MAALQIRPKILLNEGRVQQPLRVDINDGFAIDPIKTSLTADQASASSTLTVANIVGFAVNQILLIGQPGNQGAEIIKTHATTAPTGSTITLASNTVLAHSAGSYVYVLKFDQIEFSSAATATGSKSVISAASNILANQRYTEYNDTAATAGFYFARFKETIGNTFSSYSDAAPVAGYGIMAARSIIDAALHEINRETSSVLSDTFAFEQIDSCQMECIRELKRWSWMQKFDNILGQITTGSWTVAVPIDLDDQNTNKSIYKLRIGGEFKMTWVDKEKFDNLISDVAYTTLAAAINLNDLTITLTNSGDFGSTGTVQIGANTYTYTANNLTTNVLTITAAATTATNGSYVFKGATLGLPAYWTSYGGNIYYYPITAASYNGQNIYGDYYSSLVRIISDASNIIVPDPILVQYYLCWKFLKRLNNGEDTSASGNYMNLFLARKLMMKNKEVKNRTFKLKPRYNNFATQSVFNDDGRDIRDGNFTNTGF